MHRTTPQTLAVPRHLRAARTARIAVLTIFAAAIGATLGTDDGTMLRTETLRTIVALALAASLAATVAVAWERYRGDRRPQSLLLCVTVALWGAVYLPPAVLGINGEDALHHLYGPLSRTVFAVGLLAVLLPPRGGPLTRVDKRTAVLTVAALALAVAAALQVVDTELLEMAGTDALETAAVVALVPQALAAAIAGARWWRERRALDAALALAALFITAASGIFVVSEVWELRWWTAFIALVVAAVVLLDGLFEDRARQGRLAAALDSAGMSDVAEHIVETMSDGLALFDDDGRLVAWNPSAAELTGWSQEDAERHVPANTPDGLVPLGAGRWVRTQSFVVRRAGRRLRAVLFADAGEEIRALQQRESLEQRVRDRTAELERTQLEMLERLAQAAELRDDATGDHTRRVGRLAAAIAAELGLPSEQVELIRRAAPLHDVGKIGVPDHLLMKRSALEDGELAQMREHTVLGARILASPGYPLLRAAEQIALSHHERWDGRGYPHGVAGEEIPLPGRIVAVADVFDALTHDRPYKRAWSADEAIAEIARGSGSQFDRDVVVAFLQIVARGGVDSEDGTARRFSRAEVVRGAADH